MDMIKRGLALLVEKPAFRYLMGAQFAAQAGDGIVQAAIAKFIVFGGQKGFDLEGSKDPDELLRIALFVFIPYTVLSPFIGVIIDRWDRRRLLVVANGLRAVVLALIALWGTGDVGDFALFAAFLLTLMSTRVVLATKAAALPASLEGGSLVEANAVSQLGGAMFQLGGAGAAIVATKVVSADPVVLVGSVVYAAGAFLAALIDKAGEPRREKRTLRQEAIHVIASILAGLRAVGRAPKAAAAISTYLWLRLLWSFTIVGIGLVARDLLADNDLQVLIVTGGAGAVGAGLGFILANRLHGVVRTTGYLVLAASAVAGLGTAVLGAVEVKAALAILTFTLGFGFFLGKISLDTLVQEALGDDFRGRAFSLYDIAYNFAWVVASGALALWWPQDNEGGWLIASMGVVFLAGLGLLGLWYRSAGLLDAEVASEANVI